MTVAYSSVMCYQSFNSLYHCLCPWEQDRVWGYERGWWFAELVLTEAELSKHISCTLQTQAMSRLEVQQLGFVTQALQSWISSLSSHKHWQAERERSGQTWAGRHMCSPDLLQSKIPCLAYYGALTCYFQPPWADSPTKSPLSGHHST